MVVRLRLVGDQAAVEDWSGVASQAERNMMYDALFALVDGSAADRYDFRWNGGRYRLTFGDGTAVEGRIDRESFSVASIHRPRPSSNDAPAA